MLCPKYWPILPKSPLPVDLLRVRLGTSLLKSKNGKMAVCEDERKVVPSSSPSKTVQSVNQRALIGKLKRFGGGMRRLFELALLPPDSSQNLFGAFTSEPLDRREIQTYCEWKVQTCFRNLNRGQRKRSKRRIIYILPIGPFPEALLEPFPEMDMTLFELIANFVGIFFQGMKAKLMDKVNFIDINCRQRIHAVTGKLQLLVSDVLYYLKTCLPSDGFCVVGLTWVDLYPSEEWNFVLGESSCLDGCAVMSFGHFEPQSYSINKLNEVQLYRKDLTLLFNGTDFDDQSGSVYIESDHNISANLRDFAGIKCVDKQKIWRLLRVTSHEICHLFGMSHCAYFACAMNESKSILQAENQPLFLCPVCLRKLQKALGFDVVERYKDLCSFLNSFISLNDCGKETLDGKFMSAIHWLNTMMMFIEDKR